jgi:hypothetical protein
VIPAVQKWLAGLDKNDANYEHNALESLWVHQWNNVVNEPLLKQMLKAKDYHARAAAVRVLCYQRDRVGGALDLIRTAANDDSPRVRLEAVRACSFFTQPEAKDVALEALNKDDPKKPDEYIAYTLDETIKTLENLEKRAVKTGTKTARTK